MIVAGLPTNSRERLRSDRGALGVRYRYRPALPRRSAAADIARGRGAGG